MCLSLCERVLACRCCCYCMGWPAALVSALKHPFLTRRLAAFVSYEMAHARSAQAPLPSAHRQIAGVFLQLVSCRCRCGTCAASARCRPSLKPTRWLRWPLLRLETRYTFPSQPRHAMTLALITSSVDVAGNWPSQATLADCTACLPSKHSLLVLCSPNLEVH